MPFRTLLVTSAVLSGLVVSGAPALAAPGGGSGSTACRKSCPAPADTTAPSVSIATPSSGSTVASSLSVSGTASDDVQVSRVDLQVDGGTWQLANGTSSWVVSLAGLGAGSHTLTARASDAAGNTRLANVSVTTSAPADVTAPTVVISSPADGATIAASTVVSGSAADDRGVARVDVQVDGGAWQVANGTSSWSSTLAGLAAGTHTITARAADGAGNLATTSTTASVPVQSSTTLTNGEISASDRVVNDPAAMYGVVPVGRSHMASTGATTLVLYAGDFTSRRGAYLRDGSTGAESYVPLPIDVNEGWTNASYTFSTNGELWVATGEGPVRVRQYRLSGTPLPTSATLVSSTLFGDSDSRTGDLLSLASGAVVHAWHQQGATGPEGLFVSYHPQNGAWSAPQRISFAGTMPTYASKQALVQHPADGSIWLFNSPDGWGKVGGARLVEGAAGLAADWTNAYLLDPQVDGSNGPDPENPDLAAVADPYTGTVALAYQSANRRIFQTSPFLAGSLVAVARFTATGQKSFTTLPVYVERISALTLSITSRATWLSYRPIDQSTMTFARLKVARYQDGAWSTALDLGSPYDPYSRVGYGTGRPEVSVKLKDGLLHLFSLT